MIWRDQRASKYDGEAFAFLISATLRARGLNYSQLAILLDIDRSTLWRLRKGKTPTLDTFSTLCSWAGVSADVFLGINCFDDDGQMRELPTETM